MEYHSLVQGSPEWHVHRAAHYNASDAAAMLGVCPHKTRVQLLDEYKTGVRIELPEYVEEYILKPGHTFERLALPYAEDIVGEELYPVVGSQGKLSASFDGLTMSGDKGWEHKRLNTALRQAFAEDRFLEHHCFQMEQQLLVSGAERILFMASDWDGGCLLEERHAWYVSVPERRARLINGWVQFEADLATHETAAPPAPPVTGHAPDALPALRVEVQGAVTASNLAEFKTVALAAIRSVNRELKTDLDFANAESTVKWCEDVEARLMAAKAHALSQTESIDLLFRTIDDISEEARKVRLELEKLVKIRKDAIRAEIVADGVKALADHLRALNVRLGETLMPSVPADFGAAIKGKRTLATLQDAVDRELIRAKLAANELADRIAGGVRLLAEVPEHAGLFPDRAALVLKAGDDLVAVIRARIADDTQRKAEAERQRQNALQALQQPLPQAQTTTGLGEPARTVRSLPVVTHGFEMERAGGVPTLNLGTICARLGLTMTAAFVAETLGVQPRAVDKAAKLYTEGQFIAICERLEAQVALVRKTHLAREGVAA